MTSSIITWLFVLLHLFANVRGWMFLSSSSGNYNDDVFASVEPALIFPGTKWCGDGNVASGPDDLGEFKMTDACCREHDNCKDVLEAAETKHNLTNTAFYTRVHCSCDERFYDCLHNSEEFASTKVGLIYFSVLNTKCFRKDHPIIGCKRHSLTPRRCLEYELDQSQPKIYQWFDVPPYQISRLMSTRSLRSFDHGALSTDDR
ncbi:phospholipase A2-like [Pseudomyrmex gracilis]|uniref:phospholipase A2-like n=1 Tax=Pseudomyrmex gracilis TaxID=219809 RepID=UPI000995A8EA|nr:phospholipase A2-like [Pseudomyrmex gracilis]